ncbi:MAG: hypothetical protein V3T22_00105, partial [Planctomycetota bacterium]
TAQESQSADTVYLVHSPGFAWKAIHLDFSHGGEREIQLEAGGDVEIEVVGDVPERGAYLRLRQLDATGLVPYVELDLREAGPMEISGLAPGAYRVTAGMGAWYEQSQVLGEVGMEIKAGERAQVELQVELPLKPVQARLAGNVVVPTEWELSSFWLEAKLNGSAVILMERRRRISMQEMEELAGQPPMWSFDFGEIPTGPYALELSGRGELGRIEYSMRITLEPGGLGNVRFELPPPATVVVHLLDAATGQPAEVQSIHWGALGPSARYNSGLTNESPMEGAHHFEFAAPVGAIQVGSFGSGYDTLGEELQIHSGRNEFTFKLDRECPLTITFLDGEAPVLLAERWYPKPEHLDGEGKLLYTTSGTSGFKTGLSQPGRYVFEFPDFPDFEPIPSQTITVQRGEPTNHVIQLVRKQG